MSIQTPTDDLALRDSKRRERYEGPEEGEMQEGERGHKRRRIDGTQETYDPRISRVNITVGPDAVPIFVHKELLCHHSEFFRAAFGNEQYEEAKTGVITLLDQDERIFRMFVAWLYTQEVVPPNTARPEVEDDSSSHELVRTDQYMQCVDQNIVFEAVTVGETPLDYLFLRPGWTPGCEEFAEETESYCSTEAPSESTSIFDEEANDDAENDSDALPGDQSDIPHIEAYEQNYANERLYIETGQIQDIDWVELYILADQRGIGRLRDDVMTTYIYEHNRTQCIATSASIKAAFSYLPETSKMREFILSEYDCYGGKFSGRASPDDLMELPSAFLAHLLARKSSEDDLRPPHTYANLCRFHEHAKSIDVVACQELSASTFGSLDKRRALYYGVDDMVDKLRPINGHTNENL
ncbi:hypothetical protein LTR78_009701 [Recurvomyces mirabilis]|uniref:BTB domain-containing protein n=1 Tax=Recurvomyces mirabilis TaxID=574656 RepID=A0AAE0TP37_9PEZI|nr:hypothetical protein LTR78_009701 [Recurvomyces mirabilis]